MIEVDEGALKYFGVFKGLCESVFSELWFPNPFSKDVFQFNISSFFLCHSTKLYGCACIYVSLCICLCMCVHMRMCVHTCLCAAVCTCMCACVFVLTYYCCHHCSQCSGHRCREIESWWVTVGYSFGINKAGDWMMIKKVCLCLASWMSEWWEPVNRWPRGQTHLLTLTAWRIGRSLYPLNPCIC